MKKAILFFVLSLNLYGSNALNPYPQNDDLKTKVVGQVPSDLFPRYETKVETVWNITKDMMNAEPNLKAPIFVIEEFQQKKNPKEWTDFQEAWDNMELDEYKDIKEQPFNAKPLPGYMYVGTNYVQINPTFIRRPVPRMCSIIGISAPGEDNSGKWFYTVGHESLHYLLNRKKVPTKLHHCIFILKKNGGQNVLERMYSNLKRAGVVDHRVKVMSCIERTQRPCRFLTEEEKAQAQEIANQL